MVEGRTYVTSSVVFPLLKHAIDEMNLLSIESESVKHMRTTLIEDLKERMKKIGNSVKISSFFDCRFKMLLDRLF